MEIILAVGSFNFHVVDRTIVLHLATLSTEFYLQCTVCCNALVSSYMMLMYFTFMLLGVFLPEEEINILSS
jgi:hypothetical protein